MSTCMHSEAHAPTLAVQIHADYLASFQRMQTQFGNGVSDGINTYDPKTLALKVYAYGTALNSGEASQAPLLSSTQQGSALANVARREAWARGEAGA